MNIFDNFCKKLNEKLKDPDSIQYLKKNVVEPSLNIIKSELQDDNTSKAIHNTVISFLWPIILLLIINLVIGVINLNFLIFVYVRKMK